jgi:hypothetical protein
MTDNADWKRIAREELDFFGGVAAMISHEINNRFAVINEKAGLLNDLAGMLAGGKEVDPERLELQSRKIVDQVRLAKRTVGHLNRFAHSIDVETATIDVADFLEFVAALYARKASVAEVELVVEQPAETVSMTTDPFAFITLIGRGLDIALARAGRDKKIVVSAARDSGDVEVRYRGLDGLLEPVEFPDSKLGVPALLEHCGARYRSEGGAALLLHLPQRDPQPHGRTP